MVAWYSSVSATPAEVPLTAFIAGSWSTATTSRRARGDSVLSSSVIGAPRTSSGGTTIITTRCWAPCTHSRSSCAASGPCVASARSTRPVRNDSVRASGQRLPRGDGRAAAAMYAPPSAISTTSPTAERPSEAWARTSTPTSSRVRPPRAMSHRDRGAEPAVADRHSAPLPATLALAHQGLGARGDGRGRRHERPLEVRVERHRDGRRADSAHRREEHVVELLSRPRGDLGAGAEVLDGLVDDEQAARALRRPQDGVHVERDERQ